MLPRAPARPWTLERLGHLLCALLLLPAAANAGAQQPDPKRFAQVLRANHAAGVLVDLLSGRVLVRVDATRRALPGSVLKPVFLEYALQHRIVRPGTEVYCRRNLHVGSRALPCVHPADRVVFTAETALAASCNTWFARLADRYTAAQLRSALHEAGLKTPLLATEGDELRELTVLGLHGPPWSADELAAAYAKLFAHLQPTDAVFLGLQDSVRYGMANPAAVSGVTVLGKTGTASDPGEAWTHGWFAGAVPGHVLLVILVPHGDGGTAARLAHDVFTTERTR